MVPFEKSPRPAPPSPRLRGLKNDRIASSSCCDDVTVFLDMVRVTVITRDVITSIARHCRGVSVWSSRDSQGIIIHGDP